MLRAVGAVIAGMVVIGVFVFALQSFSASLYPLPEGVDPLNPDDAGAFATYLETLPATGWALAFFSELLGAFLGALVAGRIAPGHMRIVTGIVIGMGTMGSVFNWTAFEHPMWFMGGQLVGYPLFLMLAWGLLQRGAGEGDASA